MCLGVDTSHATLWTFVTPYCPLMQACYHWDHRSSSAFSSANSSEPLRLCDKPRHNLKGALCFHRVCQDLSSVRFPLTVTLSVSFTITPEPIQPRCKVSVLGLLLPGPLQVLPFLLTHLTSFRLNADITFS